MSDESRVSPKPKRQKVETPSEVSGGESSQSTEQLRTGGSQEVASDPAIVPQLVFSGASGAGIDVVEENIPKAEDSEESSPEAEESGESVIEEEESGESLSGDEELEEISSETNGSGESDSDSDDLDLAAIAKPTESTSQYVWSPGTLDRYKSQRLAKKPSLEPELMDKLEQLGYFVTEDLGYGLYAWVYKAYVHKDLRFEVPVREGEATEGCKHSSQRKCYLKEFDLGNEPCAIKKAIGNVKQEISIMELLNHRNCISFYGQFEIDGKLYIVMEYINGEPPEENTLLKFLEKYPNDDLDEWTAILIIKHITLGLEYLHRRGIAHKDLNASNIMVHHENKQMVWKIIDFGQSVSEKDSNFEVTNDLDMYIERIATVVAKSKNMNLKRAIGILQAIKKIEPSSSNRNTMTRVLQELEQFFTQNEDPPVGTAAYQFCRRYDQ